MNKLLNSFLIRIAAITIVAIILLDIFLWHEITTQNISEIKAETHLKVKSALAIIDKTSFETGNQTELGKDASEIKKITGLRTTLIGHNGTALGNSEVPVDKIDEMENHISRPEVIDALRNHVGFVKRKSATLGTEFYYYCEPILKDGKIIGFIRLALSAKNYAARINFVVYLIVAADIIFSLFIILLYISVKSLFNKKINTLYSNLEDRKRLQSYDELPDTASEPFKDIVQIINQIFEIINIDKKVSQRENKHLRNIFDSLNEGIAAFHFNGLIGFANKNFSNILNLSDELELDDRAYNIIKFPPLLKDIKKFNNKQNTINRKIRYYNDKYLKYKISKFKFEKNDIGFIVVVQDITKLHNLETIRSDFVANVSHEFKTPLTSIRGYSETLLSDTVKDDEVKKRFLRKIHHQSVYLENLVSDLLKLNRIESKGAEDIEEINICPVLNEIASEFEITAKEKNISFQFNSNCGENFIVNANTKLIYNITANFITNSIQYSKENGNVSLSVKTDYDKIRIEVKDDGIGIPDKDKSRIFERFFRVDKASAIYAEGSGLGLSIVKNAIELLSGNFGFESEENVGSLFWVELKKATL